MDDMKKYRILGAAFLAVMALAVSGCQKKEAAGSSAPAVELEKLIDEPVAADTTGADLEVLNLNSPIDFSYSNAEADMIFQKKDGQWIDGMESGIPINQDRFESMADQFLHLKAVSQVENPGDMEAYGLENEAYSVYMTDSEKGETNVLIGNQAEDGTYYMTIDENTVYTIKPETVEALIFDYNSLVVRDSLDLTVAPSDLVSVSVVTPVGSASYKTSDTAAMERIAAGISALKPTVFASYEATSQELMSAELTEDTRVVMTAEFNLNGETRSLTVYVGGFATADGSLRYVQLDGSKMISIVEAETVSDLLNETLEVSEE